MYRHTSCQKLHELYLEYKDELGKGASMYAILWRSIAPSVPELIATLDEDEELLRKIKDFTRQLLDAMESNEESRKASENIAQ